MLVNNRQFDEVTGEGSDEDTIFETPLQNQTKKIWIIIPSNYILFSKFSK